MKSGESGFRLRHFLDGRHRTSYPPTPRNLYQNVVETQKKQSGVIYLTGIKVGPTDDGSIFLSTDVLLDRDSRNLCATKREVEVSGHRRICYLFLSRYGGPSSSQMERVSQSTPGTIRFDMNMITLRRYSTQVSGRVTKSLKVQMYIVDPQNDLTFKTKSFTSLSRFYQLKIVPGSTMFTTTRNLVWNSSFRNPLRDNT